MTNVFNIKTVIIGDAGSGKSSVINRLVFNKYNNFLHSTIGAQFLMKIIGENNKLEIWDTAGQERYRALLPMYLRNAEIVLIVISLDKNNETIENEKQYWLNYLEQNNTMTQYYKKILVYNKCDLNPDFTMDNDERFDSKCKVSCKTNIGIEQFINSLENILANIKQDDLYNKMKIHSSANININSLNKKKSIKCSLL
jgi:small GTP-binding protein